MHPKALLLAAAVLPRGRGHCDDEMWREWSVCWRRCFLLPRGAWSQVPCCVHDLYQNQHQKGQADHDPCVCTLSTHVLASAVAKLAAKTSRFWHPTSRCYLRTFGGKLLLCPSTPFCVSLLAQATPRPSTSTHLHSPFTTTTLWQSSRQRRWPGPSFPLSIATHHCPSSLLTPHTHTGQRGLLGCLYI
jgi:hypothetical protein